MHVDIGAGAQTSSACEVPTRLWPMVYRIVTGGATKLVHAEPGPGIRVLRSKSLSGETGC